MSIAIEAIDPSPPVAGEPAPGELGIALLGCGTVGSAVVRALEQHREALAGHAGRVPALRAIAVRHLEKPRPSWVPPALLTADAVGAVEREDVDVVIEVIGGLDPAGGLIEVALARGKDVVTANKELLARRWRCLETHTRGPRPRIRLEAAVLAGVPVVSPLASLAAGDRVISIEGILNGTSNYCLHRIEEGVELPEALAEARELGLAEPDSSSDVDGRDAAAKLAVLASIGFNRTVGLEEVAASGIEGVTPRDLRRARAGGHVLRLVARARQDGEAVHARVSPEWVALDHPLAAVTGHHNAVAITAELAGAVLLRGPGAGGDATASAILSDLVRTAHALERSPA